MKTVQGAEAILEFRDGKILKKRERKNYRHPDLDKRIRKGRTQRENRIIKEARKNGANVPSVSQKSDYVLEMEKIQGEDLKEHVDNTELFIDLGRNVYRLHDADIIHGDLTTRNAIVSEETDVVLIDFGLAERSGEVEDKAVDLHLLKQVLESSHPEIAEDAWKEFLNGYQEYENSEEILERLEEVEKRGRYK